MNEGYPLPMVPGEVVTSSDLPQECDLGQQSVLHAVQLVHRVVGASAERTASESEPLNKTINKILERQEPEEAAGELLP